MAKKHPVNKYGLYMVVTLDEYELPLCVGSLDEIAEYEGVKTGRVLGTMNQARYRNGKCKYIKIE